MSLEDWKIQGDPAIVSSTFREFHAVFDSLVDQLGKVMDKAIDVNKQAVALHERMMLLSLGTIGVSVSAIVSLGARTVGSTTAVKLAFMHYIAPSWVLLLLSALACRNAMVNTINANSKLLQDWSRRVQSNILSKMSPLLAKLSKAVTGTVMVNGTAQDVSDRMTNLLKELLTVVDELNKPDIAVVPTVQRSTKINSFLSVLCMQIGLVLLCIGAIKFLLS